MSQAAEPAVRARAGELAHHEAGSLVSGEQKAPVAGSTVPLDTRASQRCVPGRRMNVMWPRDATVLTLSKAIDELRRDPGRTVRARLGDLVVEMHRVASGPDEEAEQRFSALVDRGMIAPAAVVDSTPPPCAPVAPASEILAELRNDRDAR